MVVELSDRIIDDTIEPSWKMECVNIPVLFRDVGYRRLLHPCLPEQACEQNS